MRRLVVLALAAIAAGFAVLVVLYVQTRVPLPGTLAGGQGTVVTMADGSPLGVIENEQDRTVIPLSQVPVPVRQAVLAAEDRHFYSEAAISIPGIARAALSDLVHRRIVAGGSTITQQYVKNAYLGSQRTFTRKLREALIAVKLERRDSKDEILGLYLNTIYFGRGAYGIEAAAETYFGIPASKLDVAQGAVLAASIQAPELLDPSVDPAPAIARWHYVLGGMVKDHALTAPAAAAITYPAVRPRGAGTAAGRGRLSGETGYLLDMTSAELEARGFTAAQVFSGGLRVRTTLVPKDEAAAVAAVSTVLPKAADPQAALVAVQPGTGRILAVYGGRDYAVRQFNNATQAFRQPGSSFKPFVLAAALDKGISLRSTYNGSSPQTFPGYGQPVTNFNNEQFGSIDLVTATANSVNTVYVPLGEQAGEAQVVDMARAAGIPAADPHDGLQAAVPLQADPSLALGTSEVHPIDQAVAYATFAARGRAAAPYLVDQVTDAHGKVLYRAAPDVRSAIRPSVVADLTYALEQVVARGTGNPEAVLAGGRPAAGKTGTTSSNKDAWFVGYTPSLSASVWMGDDPKSPTDPTTLTGVEGVAVVTGGTLPARIWKQFMDAALAGTPIETFPPPVFGGTTPTTSTSAASTTTSSTSTSTSTSTTSTSTSTSTTSLPVATSTTPPNPTTSGTSTTTGGPP